LGIDRLDDVTADLLGASQHELAAFHMAVMGYILARERVTYREAIEAMWANGDWRRMVSEWVPLQWERARQATAADALVEPGGAALSKADLLVIESLAGGPKHGDGVAEEVLLRTGSRLDREALVGSITRLVGLGYVVRIADTQTAQGPRRTWALVRPG
jgi:hypothetical protein